jgi:hypothetical protein
MSEHNNADATEKDVKGTQQSTHAKKKDVKDTQRLRSSVCKAMDLDDKSCEH